MANYMIKVYLTAPRKLGNYFVKPFAVNTSYCALRNKRFFVNTFYQAKHLQSFSPFG